MSSLADKIARAREVAAKATPGPLYSEEDPGADCPECDAPQETEYALIRSKTTTGGVAIVMEDDRAEKNALLYVLAVNALTALLDVAEAADRVHRAYLACCNEETACDADTDNFHGAAINLDAALARLSEVL